MEDRLRAAGLPVPPERYRPLSFKRDAIFGHDDGRVDGVLIVPEDRDDENDEEPIAAIRKRKPLQPRLQTKRKKKKKPSSDEEEEPYFEIERDDDEDDADVDKEESYESYVFGEGFDEYGSMYGGDNELQRQLTPGTNTEPTIVIPSSSKQTKPTWATNRAPKRDASRKRTKTTGKRTNIPKTKRKK